MRFDSNEELYFSWWLDELVKAGPVIEYQRGSSFSLSEPVKIWVEKELKTKTKMIEKHLMNGHIYTPDFIVLFRPSFAEKCKIHTQTGGISFIEVKGDYDAQNMTRLFSINKKWIYQVHGKVINLVKIPLFFEKTFTPDRYLITDKSGKPRKIKKEFVNRTLKQFMG